MRVLVTGGCGFIGSHFVKRLVATGYEVVVLDKLTYSGNPANLAGLEHEFHEGDIADADAVARAAKGVEAIVNFAAETHVDRSIMGPAEFILTDVLGTQVLLDHARRHGIRHLQVSTDEVYGDGRQVRDWLHVDDQRGSPTYVGHLAEATKDVLALPFGIYHVAAGGDCTWADFAEAIFAEAGLDTRVRRITSAEFGARAARPAYSVLRSEKDAPELPHWREGLRECLSRLT